MTAAPKGFPSPAVLCQNGLADRHEILPGYSLNTLVSPCHI